MKHTQQTKSEIRMLSGADDLKLIHGIGPGIEARFYKAGITTYEQLAGFTPEEIVASLGGLIGLTVDRVIKQEWISQANELASNKRANPAESLRDTTTPGDHLHYATFTVEFLLNEENGIRRTRTMHVQSLQEKTWAGWDKDLLINFITESGKLQITRSEPIPDIIQEMEGFQTEAEKIWGGKPRLSEFLTIPVHGDSPRRFLPYGQPFNIHLAFDLPEVSTPDVFPLAYTATFYAKQLGSRVRKSIGQIKGSSLPFKVINVDMEGATLPEGAYRLEAEVNLRPEIEDLTSTPELKTLLEGNLIQIY